MRNVTSSQISSHVGRLFTEPLELSVQNIQSMQGVNHTYVCIWNVILELSNGFVRSKFRKICGVRSLMEFLGEEVFEWKNGKIFAQRNAIEQEALFTSVQKAASKIRGICPYNFLFS